ncbi:hypothetical protein BC830DRAFT_1169910 [Chytriomyces sp. MP71]|nr:hypothetical protein BC830DRAFT_1169910 [Chytriomyces sp. MP71]
MTEAPRATTVMNETPNAISLNEAKVGNTQPPSLVPPAAQGNNKLGVTGRANIKLGSSQAHAGADAIGRTSTSHNATSGSLMPPTQSATGTGIFNFNSALSGTSTSSFKRRPSATGGPFQSIFGNSPLSDSPDPARLAAPSGPSTRVPGPVAPATSSVGINLPSNNEDEEEPKLVEPVAPKAELLKDLAKTFGPEETTKKSIEARVNERRFMMVEEVVHRLRDPVIGIELKDRSKLFQVYKNSFTGSFDSRSKNGVRIAQTLMDYSYIIPVDMDYKFKEASLYIFQTSFLWPTVPWTNLGRDYFIYLIKRTQRSSKQQQLTVAEEQRLERLMLKFKKTRDEIAQAVKTQSEFTETLSKNDKRIFFLQEHAFWKYQRPLQQTANTPSPTMKDDSTMRVRTFEEYLVRTPFSGEGFAVASVELYEKSASIYFSKKAKQDFSIFERTVAFQIVDPFVEQWADNPFICDDPKIWDTAKTIPTPNDIKIWKRHISELLNDPLGLKLFSDFLRKEESIDSLDMFLKVRALDNIASYDEYVCAATEIFNEFVPMGSPREVNITFGIRSRLVATFTILKNQIEQQQAKIEMQAASGTLNKTAKERAAGLPVVSLFQGAGVASPSVMNLNGSLSMSPPGGGGGVMSMADVTASMVGLSRMMTITEGGASRPAILAHQYQQLQENRKRETMMNFPPTIDENKKSASLAGDMATSAALTPERLATWRLPHDCFSATSQHILVVLGRDAFAKFWASEGFENV